MRLLLFNGGSLMLLYILSWFAVIILSVSYWFQIIKIHRHKEVRDLSLPYHVLLATGFAILAFTAYYGSDTIFLVKQVATTVPVVIIILQILYHRNDKWHDDEDALCVRCRQELEPSWHHCPYCGNKQCNITGCNKAL